MIIVQCNDEVALFFSDAVEAENYLEAIDVDNGEYPRAFDAQGNLYALRAIDNRVLVKACPRLAPAPAALEALVRQFLAFAKIPTTGEESLGELLELCASRVDDWKRRDAGGRFIEPGDRPLWPARAARALLRRLGL